MNANPNEFLIPATTVAQLVGIYRQSEQEIRQAFSLIEGARQRLRTQFGDHHYGFDVEVTHGSNRRACDTADELMGKLKKDAWRILVDRMELRRVLSIKRAAELDEQLESGNGLPEIDETQILAMMEGTLMKTPDYLAEAVKEVFNWLRPHSSYKTNEKWKVGRKVVLKWCVTRAYGRVGFRINYHREQNLTALENVFLMLDGKGTVKTSHAALRDAIDKTTTGSGETDYFKFKCFKNQNLHLEFKRLDLVDKLNLTAETALPGVE